VIFAEYYGKQSWRVPIRMIRTARWKYVRYLGHGEELYDLDADAGELRNLSNETEFVADRKRLAEQMDAWIQQTDDPFPRLTRTDRSGKVLAADPTK
jgi:arylsulfatase A-like enzyme